MGVNLVKEEWGTVFRLSLPCSPKLCFENGINAIYNALTTFLYANHGASVYVCVCVRERDTRLLWDKDGT